MKGTSFIDCDIGVQVSESVSVTAEDSLFQSCGVGIQILDRASLVHALGAKQSIPNEVLLELLQLVLLQQSTPVERIVVEASKLRFKDYLEAGANMTTVVEGLLASMPMVMAWIERLSSLPS